MERGRHQASARASRLPRPPGHYRVATCADCAGPGLPPCRPGGASESWRPRHS
jgi:hypothetical protein